MDELNTDQIDKLIELACFCQICMRRARMESPLSQTHSERLGQGIKAAERIEEIGRTVIKRFQTLGIS